MVSRMLGLGEGTKGKVVWSGGFRHSPVQCLHLKFIRDKKKEGDFEGLGREVGGIHF